MRILIVAEVFLPKIDGVVSRTLNLIDHLQAAGDEVLVICPEAEGCQHPSVPVVSFRSFPFLAYPEYRIGLPDRRLVETVRTFAPDVVHFINPFAFGFRCYDVLRRAGLRQSTVFSFHTLYGEFVKRYGLLRPLSSMLWWLTRSYHNQADANITVSSIMQQELAKRGFQRVHCWPPAVDSQLFHPQRRTDAMRERLSCGRSTGPLLLTVSRLAPEKNVDFLADVVRQLGDCTLAIVGDGPQRAALEKRFAGLNANFVGYLKGAALAEAYASADAFIYASETETMGNVILEAMASGLAVIAPQAGGIPSLVRSGETGLLFHPGDLADATRCARQMIENPALRQQLAQAARTTVAEWTWAHSIERVREIYGRTIEQKKRDEGRRGVAPGLVLASLTSGFRAVAPLARRTNRKPAARQQHLSPHDRERATDRDGPLATSPKPAESPRY